MRLKYFVAVFLLTSVTVLGQDSTENSLRLPQWIDVESERLDHYLQAGNYQHVSLRVLRQLLNRLAEAEVPVESSIERAEYSAVVMGERLSDGHVKLTLSAAASLDSRPAILGSTNLDDLKLFVENRAVPLASNANGDLIPLLLPQANTLTGQWSAAGKSTGAGVDFGLELPAASVSVFYLQTAADTVVTSSNSTVVKLDTGAEGVLKWALYPRTASKLHIHTESRYVDSGRGDVLLSPSAEVEVKAESVLVEWQISLPITLENSVVHFRLSPPCQVETVVLENGAPCEWALSKDGSTLQVSVGEISAATILKILAEVDNPVVTSVSVPLLTPKFWKSTFGESGGKIDVRFNPVQITVDSDFLVTDLQLRGLMERDVSYSAEGAQTLVLLQYHRNASATLKLAPAEAVISDSVVIKLNSGKASNTATAFIFANARAGRIGSLRWALPRSWRVTRVTELSSGLPLLFRMNSASSDSDVADVDILLKSPLSAATSEAGQGIVATLQSTAAESSGLKNLPLMVNPQYHRLANYICMATDDVGSKFTDDRFVPVAVSDVREQAGWLPTDLLTSISFFEQPQLPPGAPDPESLPHDEIYANVDYVASTAGDVVTESIRIRLRSEGQLPQRIPIRVTPGLTVSVADAPENQQEPSVRILGDAETGDWVLDISADGRSVSTVACQLICRRLLQERISAALVEIPNSRLAGGSIRPPREAFVMHQGTVPVTEVSEYPEDPLAGNWYLEESSPPVSRMDVSCKAFIHVTELGDRLRLEGLQQQYVKLASQHDFLSVSIPECERFEVLVDGRPVYVERSNGFVQIPLGRNERSSFVTVTWETQFPAESVIDVSLPGFPEANTATCDAFLLSPDRCEFVPSPGSTYVASESVTELLRDSTLAQNGRPIASSVESFCSRWYFDAGGSEKIFHTRLNNLSQPTQVGVSYSVFSFTQVVVISLMCFWLWYLLERTGIANRRLPVIVAVIVLTFSVTSAFPSRDLQNGVLWGCLGFAAFQFLPSRRRAMLPSSGSFPAPATSVVKLVVFLAACLSVSYADELPQVLQPPSQRESANEYCFVEESFLHRLKGLPSRSREALVLSSDVTVTMESESSCLAEISCHLACPQQANSELNLPLTGLTLIEADLDGIKVFPSRVDADHSRVSISPQDGILHGVIDPSREASASRGPGVIGKWDLRRFRYTVRYVPRRLPADFRIQFAVPPSVDSLILFQDKSGLVESVSSPVANGRQRRRSGITEFRTRFATGQIDLSVRIANSQISPDELQQHCAMVCSAEVTPAQLRLTCQYRLRLADARLTRVLLKSIPDFRIVRVETLDGKPVTWSQTADDVIVNVTSSDNRLHEFLIELRKDTPTSLRHDVPTGALATVNRIKAQSIALLTKTTDQFFVNSASIRSEALPETEVSPDVRGFEISRGVDRMISVPASAAKVQVTLEEIQATRTVRLQQKAIVDDNRVDWECLCEIDVVGQPIFRQAFQVSPDVRIHSVSASRDGVSRLQSWTRHNNQVVISLREATRGELEVQLTGAIDRVVDRDTSLPVIRLPDSVQVTESDLHLSSRSATATYVKSLGSAVASDLTTVTEDPVPDSPIHFVIGDESMPVVLRGAEEKQVAADFCVMLYETDSKPRCALFMKFDPKSIGFDIHFRCPRDQFGSRRPVMIDGGEVRSVRSTGERFVVPRMDGDDRDQAVIAFGDISLDMSGSEILCPIPTFDGNLNLQSLTSFDVRESSGRVDGLQLPVWVSTTAEFIGITDLKSQHDLLEARFDGAAIRVPLQEKLPVVPVPVSVDPDSNMRVETRHLIELSTTAGTAGESGFFIFRTQPGDADLKVPEHIRLIDLKVNGQSQNTRTVDAIAQVKLPERINFVSASWIDTDPGSFANIKRSMPLPYVIAPHVNAIAMACVEKSKPLMWNVETSPLDIASIHRANEVGVRRGLELATADESYDSTDDIGRHGVSQHDWDLISSESPDAAADAMAFFNRCALALPDAQSTAIDRSGLLRFTFVNYPTTSGTLAFFICFTLVIATYFVERARDVRSTPDLSSRVPAAATADDSGLTSLAESSGS